jgi:DNA-nicking Smr family endonuclease
MSRRHQPSREDLDLFRHEVQDVVPLDHGKVEPIRNLPSPVPRQRWEDERRVLRELLTHDIDPADLETGEEACFVRPGIQQRSLRKLRRGQYSISAELDLHGMTVPAAHEALVCFLDNARARGHHCVRIIHGKGKRSPGREPVLKHKASVWLARRQEVLAFCSARPVDGGTGALYVLLRGRRKRDW